MTKELILEQIQFNDDQAYLDEIIKNRDLFSNLYNHYKNPDRQVDASFLLGEALKSYDTLKEQLSQIIPEHRMRLIEQQVIKYAISNTKYLKLLYIPDFQSKYEEPYDDLIRQRDNAKSKLESRFNAIDEKWRAREDKYNKFEREVIFPSIFIVGLPLLIGELVVSCADALITWARLKFKNFQTWKVEKQCEAKIQKLKYGIQNEIDQNPQFGTEQNFFQVAKLRFSPEIQKAERELAEKEADVNRPLISAA